MLVIKPVKIVSAAGTPIKKLSTVVSEDLSEIDKLKELSSLKKLNLEVQKTKGLVK